MVLMKEGLWSIVSGTEQACCDLAARRDRSSALIGLHIQPSLLHCMVMWMTQLLFWRKLADQLQKKTWASKLHLQKRLNSLKLRERDSVNEHIHRLTEIFHELAFSSPVEEDRVVHSLASLPESYGIPVTALEASSEVPSTLGVKAEREAQSRKQLQGSTCLLLKKRAGKCYHCGKTGHFKNCHFLSNDGGQNKKTSQPTLNKASVGQHSEGECDALVVEHVLQAGAMGNWIVNSGATCNIRML